nr:caM kinase-like vesicle-associated protein [Quercus suber]
MAQLETLRSNLLYIRFDWQAVQATFRLEGAANDQGKALDAEREKHLEATQTLKTSEADLTTARKELKAMTRARDNAVSGLTSAQKQAQDQTRRLTEAEEQLEIPKELVADLTKKVAAAEGAKNAAECAKDEALRAKAEADFGRVKAQASKEEAEEAAYAAGVAETEAAFKVQVPGYVGATVPSSEAEMAVEEASATPAEGASVAGLVGEPVKGGDPPGVVESSKGPNEEAPQEVANPSSDAQVSSVEEATILAMPLLAIPLSQSSEDPKAATNQPPTRGGGGEIKRKE